MLKRWVNRLRIAWVKRRMRVIAEQVMAIHSVYYCREEMLRILRPDIVGLERKFNALNERLKSIDPDHPANRG